MAPLVRIKLTPAWVETKDTIHYAIRVFLNIGAQERIQTFSITFAGWCAILYTTRAIMAHRKGVKPSFYDLGNHCSIR